MARTRARTDSAGEATSSRRGSASRKVPGAGLIISVLSALVLPLWLLTFAAWAVQLAGIAAVQYDQGRHFLQFDWFVTSLEFVVLSLMFFNIVVRRSTPGLLALKAVATVLEILRTNAWNNARLGNNAAGANFVQLDSVTNPGLAASRARIDTAFAGYLITSALNCLLMLALGSLPAFSAQDVEQTSSAASKQTSRMEREDDPLQTEGYTSTGNAGSQRNKTAPTRGAHQVPGTHLTETEDQGLHGPTYINGASRV